MLPDPFDFDSLSRPDTEIKIIGVGDTGPSSGSSASGKDAGGDKSGRISLLRELRDARRAGASVYHVDEPMLVGETRLLGSCWPLGTV